MKLVTYSGKGGAPRAGIAIEQGIADLANGGATLGLDLPDHVSGLLTLGDDGLQQARQVGAAAQAGKIDVKPLADVHLHAALPNPTTMYLLAGNYQSHIEESGMARVDKNKINPRVFVKPGSAVIGTGDPIRIPAMSDTVDYELEIAAVIGTGGKNISVSDASDHLAGYVVFNDVSARGLKIAEGREERNGDWFFDWLLGKWCDSFAAIGPYLVTTDEAGDPQKLEMALRVNGDLKQHSSAGEMIFTIPEALVFLAQFVTLRPGDMLCMGTPGGVGYASSTFLKPGDEIVAEIERLGKLVNPVV